MNLQQLRYFCSIADRNNFTRAAKDMSVTQSTLSHAINELEKELNAPLFNRSGRNITLTPFGQVLLEHVDPALKLLDGATAKLKDMTDPESGMISVANLSSLNDLMTFAVSGYYVDTGRYFSRFRFFPFTDAEIDEALENGTCDLALTLLRDNPNMDYYPIGVCETVIAVSLSHQLAKYEAIHLGQLRNEKIVSYESTTRIRAYIAELFKQAGFEPNIVFETVNDNVVYSAVAANVGVALLPRPLGTVPTGIKLIRIIDDIPPRIVALARNKNRYLPKAAENFFSYFLKQTDRYSAFLHGQND